jgi:hypothetical protein
MKVGSWNARNKLGGSIKQIILINSTTFSQKDFLCLLLQTFSLHLLPNDDSSLQLKRAEQQDVKEWEKKARMSTMTR